MTTEELTRWLTDLPKTADQFSIVFLQLGHAFQEVRDAVNDAPGTHISALDFLAEGTQAVDGPFYLDGLETLTKDRGARLGALRERVMAAIAEGRPVILISTAPKTAYPDTVGSDVVSDAKQLIAPPSAMTVPTDSDGTRALNVDYYIHCLRELGDQTLIALADALWESQLSPSEALEVLSKPDIEALRGAGLVQAQGSSTIEWLTRGSFKQFRLAVALVSSESIGAGVSVPDTFAELWTLERMIRNMIRGALVRGMGDGWRESCLSRHLRDDVLERARRDSQPRAERMRDLRDPLEWLTTTELLDLRETRKLGGLGIEPYLWAKLRTEIVPIRNKVAHMRMVSDADARRAQMWRKLIAARAG